jgi:hypothetical protein
VNAEDLAAGIKDRWNMLVTGAAVVGAALSGFVLPPPFSADSVDPWVKLGGFLTAAMIGLFFVPMTKWKAKRFAWRWFGAAIALLLASVIVYFNYTAARDRHSVAYAGTRLVHGSTLRPDARQYRDRRAAENAGAYSDAELLMDHAGAVDDVWDPADRPSLERQLAALYLLTLLLFGLALVTVVQTTYCVTTTNARKPRPGSTAVPPPPAGQTGVA